MGIYTEYLDRQMSFQDLAAERKAQLQRISALRGGRDILVFAADLSKGQAPISIGYNDLLPVNDHLANLNGSALDLILETPGGSGEAAEDIVRSLRSRYNDLAIIVPGWAKSAGTIMVMAADEILMDAASALGPIDAQIFWQGKVFSADALLEGFEKMGLQEVVWVEDGVPRSGKPHGARV
jgi:ClpP class serine protease